MAFTWKDKKDIWKGEGIYFLTFVTAGRQKLLGELVRIMEDGRYAPVRPTDQLDPRMLYGRWDSMKFGEHSATVRLNALGFEIAKDLQNITKRHPGYELCGKQIMENHLHLVIWVHDDGGRSIKQWAHGFRMGITQIARENGLWPQPPVTQSPVAQSSVVKSPVVGSSVLQTDEDVHAIHSTKNGRTLAPGEPSAYDSHEGGLLLEKAFIRTLSHKGQLKNMLQYTHNNPDNLLLMIDNPDLYVIRRNQEHGGLHFDTMGKARLLDYPDRNVVALSRSLTPEQIAAEVQKVLRLAESGAVTYCAAMNDGEKAVTKAIRAAGYPLVVMMQNGFPPEGTEAARFFHPGGAYHKACGEGRLYLMAPLAANYNDPRLIELTEKELMRKAEEKHRFYTPLPRTSTRWRMIAINMMLEMFSGAPLTL